MEMLLNVLNQLGDPNYWQRMINRNKDTVNKDKIELLLSSSTDISCLNDEDKTNFFLELYYKEDYETIKMYRDDFNRLFNRTL